ncbi:hypothetical protein N7530_008802 [Penicillium desertorum]|uniref:Uncharacterized protein n=1 Tax=Penicillium desertorum TaxID=1303715 RepID=A0A9W9WPS0_9EURO|nr:hypothetical protein N7530_008802 [Penicillium desertorum]
MTIRHSFKRCGLWSFDPEVICKGLRDDHDEETDLVVYDQGKEYELPEWGEKPVESEEYLPETSPASSSIINSPPTLKKLRQDVSNVQKSIATLKRGFHSYYYQYS